MPNPPADPAVEALYSPALLTALSMITKAMKAARVRYAVGGSLAMAAHGYRRDTADIDVFIAYEDKPAAMRAVRKLGWPTATVFGGFHHIAEIPGYNIEELHVDLLFPSDDPDWSAVEAPDSVRLGNVKFDAFPLLLLFLAKVQAAASTGDDKDKHFADLKQMWQRGLIEERPLLKLARQARMLAETKTVLRRIAMKPNRSRSRSAPRIARARRK